MGRQSVQNGVAGSSDCACVCLQPGAGGHVVRVVTANLGPPGPRLLGFWPAESYTRAPLVGAALGLGRGVACGLTPRRAKLFGEPACRGALLLNPCYPCWWQAFPTSRTRPHLPAERPWVHFQASSRGSEARTAPGQGVGVLLFRSWEVSAYLVPSPSASVTGPWNLLPAKLLSPPALAP